MTVLSYYRIKRDLRPLDTIKLIENDVYIGEFSWCSILSAYREWDVKTANKDTISVSFPIVLLIDFLCTEIDFNLEKSRIMVDGKEKKLAGNYSHYIVEAVMKDEIWLRKEEVL